MNCDTCKEKPYCDTRYDIGERKCELYNKAWDAADARVRSGRYIDPSDELAFQIQEDRDASDRIAEYEPDNVKENMV